MVHLVTHLPPEQYWPLAHVLPHLPQLDAEVLRLTHAPAQLVKPMRQHLPLAQ